MILISTIISRVLEPFVLQFLLILLTALRAGMHGWELAYTMIKILIVVLIPPMLLLLWAVRSKKISNWDISNRHERVRALALFLCIFAIDLVIIFSMRQTEIAMLFLFFFITLIGFFSITLFWKLSGHLSTTVIFIGMVIHWYGSRWWPLLVLVPLLAWSRVTLKRHTIAETLGGILYGSLMYEIWISFF